MFDILFKGRSTSYTFDFYNDVPIKSENSLDAELREKLRSLLLYDLMFKMQQETEIKAKTDLIMELPRQNQVHASFQLENILTLILRFEFKDILEVSEEPQQHPFISKGTMLRLLINLGETTFSANVIKNLFFMLSK